MTFKMASSEGFSIIPMSGGMLNMPDVASGETKTVATTDQLDLKAAPYPFADAVFSEDGGAYTCTLAPFKNNQADMTSQSTSEIGAFTVAVSASPVANTMRDMWFVVITGATAPTITWPSGFDRFDGGSAAAVAPTASATNIYRITEYESGKFEVSKQGVFALASAVPSASSSTPQMDGTASAGSSAAYSCGDHVHPSDTAKLDAVAGAVAFSSSLTYTVGQYVTYNSRFYECTVAVTTAGAWTGPVNWIEVSIGDVLKILNTASLDLGTLAPYPLIGALTPASHPFGVLYTPVDRAQQSITLTNGTTQIFLGMPTPTTILSLPWATYFAARDFVVDVDNSANGSDVDIDFTDLGMTFDLAIPAGQTIADITTVAAGTRARFYFSEMDEVYESGVFSNIPCIALHRLDLDIINSNTQ